MSKLLAVTPLGGRYRNEIEELEEYTSEYALIKNRVGIEIKYLIALSKIGLIRKFSKNELKNINSIYEKFNLREAEKVKEIEETTRHDVKALEIYLRRVLRKSSLKDIAEFIHLGITSEDINNISYRLMLRSSAKNVIIPVITKISESLFSNSQEYKNVAMLARTHGQPAVPTTLGKEFAVFASRLRLQLKLLNKTQLTGKLNGAVGNYNALQFAYPKINWTKFSQNFIKSFNLEPNLVTTQINSNEDIIEYLQTIQRINGILLDLDQDLWHYISDGWLVHSTQKGQIGSSTMPQKINPIDFENSEGNLEFANGLIEVFTRELAISRLQRDLSNSTILRNIGTVLGYSLLAYKSCLSGLSKIAADRTRIAEDLNKDWSILTEALQTILRLEKVEDAYLKVVEMTKGKHLGEKEWKELVQTLKISEPNKQKLLKLTPSTYLGLARLLAMI